MTRTEQIPIVRSIPSTEIEEQISLFRCPKTKTEEKVLNRWKFVRMRYRGFTPVECADALNINHQTAYNWQGLWNEGGPAALIPGYGIGRPSKISQEQKESLLEEIRKHPMSTREAGAFIKDRFHIDYTGKQVGVILRKMGLRHAKPYQMDFRRPSDPEGIIKKTSPMLWME